MYLKFGLSLGNTCGIHSHQDHHSPNTEKQPDTFLYDVHGVIHHHVTSRRRIHTDAPQSAVIIFPILLLLSASDSSSSSPKISSNVLNGVTSDDTRYHSPFHVFRLFMPSFFPENTGGPRRASLMNDYDVNLQRSYRTHSARFTTLWRSRTSFLEFINE